MAGYDVEKDERVANLSKEDIERIKQIPSAIIQNNCVNILDCIHTIETTEQYMSQDEFRKWIPIYNRDEALKYIRKHGQKAFDDFVNVYYKKYNVYKPVTLVNNYSDKTELAVLPSPAIAFPTMKTDVLGVNKPLEEANRKLGVTSREDVVYEGHLEYLNLIDKARRDESAIAKYAEANIETKKQIAKLDKLRDDYYKAKYKGIKPSGEKAQASSSVTSDFDDDDECY